MKELTIPIRTKDRIPIYEQIYEYIKCDIRDGKISDGEKLPSTRFLAKLLQVSRSTVELAYDQLLSEGYVRALRGSGFYVCRLAELEPVRGKGIQRPVREAFGGQGPEGQLEKRCQLAEDRTDKPSIRYDFSPNDIEWPEFSMNAWRKAARRMLQEPMEELFQAGESQGEANLRQAICDYLHQSRGVSCHRSQIVIGAGNEYLLLLLHQLLGDVKGIAMESPTYRQACQIFSNMGWKVAAIPMDDSGMELPELQRSGMQVAYVMPSHQFPLGTVMPMGRRSQLLSWAGEQPGRYLIEDDYDSEFRYRGKPIPSLQGSDPYGRVIYLGTFSKSIAPAIRVSYMVLPLELMAPYRERCGFYSSTVSRLQQQMLYHFMKDGYFERHLNKMRSIYRARHDRLTALLRQRPWVLRLRGEGAGLHVLAETDPVLPEQELVARAGALGVRVYGLREYMISEGQPQPWGEHPVLLFGYGALDEEQITEGIHLLDQVFGWRP
ncbi:MAG: PLP-dependent aminotransferase family protein [Lachnospiraceae bacterium]|nr:PLP-dependent aminotransferase family protein [Lachnospiraceae bacterium]